METDNTRIMNGENDTAAKRAMGLLMTVSHEVREPLNAITELTELALRGSLPASTRGQLRRIGEATRYISDIMSDLLDLSMFETGRLALSPKEFQLDPLIRETADLFSVRCKAAGVSFTCRVSPKVREAYVGDAGRIRQIVTNLLGSALSHTSRGGEIILDVREEAERLAWAPKESVNIPLGQLRGRLEELDRKQPYIILCAVGVRAYTAARILLQHGFDHIKVYPGGARLYRSLQGK